MILDFIPNHTGKKHEWFNKSQANEEVYKDYYIWADGTGADMKSPPNDWVILKSSGCISQSSIIQLLSHFNIHIITSEKDCQPTDPWTGIRLSGQYLVAFYYPS